MGRRTYCLTVSYDGTRYKGWQRLPNALTVQGRLEEALSRIFEEPIEISGSGRTDAGVHALGQVASFTAPERPVDRVVAQLRHLLPGDIGIVGLRYAPERFHARLSAVEKTYVYRLWNSASPDVFGRHYRTNFPRPLNEEAMRAAATLLLGKHDFLGFCANKHFKKSSIRELRRLEICRRGEELCFVLTADGFLHHMVRVIVGTLLEVGLEERNPESALDILQSRDRSLAGQTAPAEGLCLLEVRYDEKALPRQKVCDMIEENPQGGRTIWLF